MSTTKSAEASIRRAAPSSAANRDPRFPCVPAAHHTPGTPAGVFVMVVRSLLAIILIWAGLSKLGDPVGAYTAVLAYQLPAPAILLKLAAVTLPWLELLCSLMLLANFHRRLATLVTAVLLSVFLVALGQALVRGLDISCGCFNLAILRIAEASPGARFIESVGFALARNVALLGSALYLLRAERQSPSGDAPAKAQKAP